MNNRIRSLLLAGMLFSMSACVVQEPEGPAEQIGKGVDMITGGLKQYDKDAQDSDDGHNNFDRRAKDQFGNYKDDFYKPQPGDDRPNPGDFDSRVDQQGYYKQRDATADDDGTTYQKKAPSTDSDRDDRRY